MLHALVIPVVTVAHFLSSLPPFTNGLLARNVQGFYTAAITSEPGRYHRPAVTAADPWGWPDWQRGLASVAMRWNLSNMYGMFIKMTGVDGSRPEVVIEAAVAAASGQPLQWCELPFRFKPGALSRRPPWEAPHNARLDYSMWLTSVDGEDTPAFVWHFCRRLMEGSTNVAQLLDYNQYRSLFPTPPDFVRVLDYQYQFATGPQWWRRTLLATGKPFGRERLSALGPEVARAYVISVDLQCGLGARLLLRLRGWIFRLTGGSPTQFVWFCFAVPVCGRVLWWLYGRRRGFSSSFSSHA